MCSKYLLVFLFGCFFGFYTSVSADDFNFNYNRQNSAQYSWQIWRQSTAAETDFFQNLEYDAQNKQHLVLNVAMNKTPYLFLQLNKLTPLAGRLIASGSLMATQTDGISSEGIRIYSCFNIKYPVLDENKHELLLTTIPIDGHWYNFTIDPLPLVQNYQQTNLTPKFALSQLNTFSAYSDGIGLCIFNDNYLTSGAIHLKIAIDSLKVSGDTPNPDFYLQAGSKLANEYLQTIKQDYTRLNQNITSTGKQLSQLIANQSAELFKAILKQQAIISSNHLKILNEVGVSQFQLPNQDQYLNESDAYLSLQELLQTSQSALSHHDQQLNIYALDQPSEYRIINNSVGVTGTPIESFTLSSAKNHTQAFSFVIQNWYTSQIDIKHIDIQLSSPTTTFPSSDINIRIVKNWYVGSRTSIRVNQYQLSHPTLQPELLVKNDDLIRVDTSTQKNYLRLSDGPQHFVYQDISSAKILMPKKASSNDSAELMPFSIPAFQNKQIWVDFRIAKSIKPGTYTGMVSLDYVINQRHQVKNLPLTFTILPVDLPASGLTYGLYYRGQIKSLNNQLVAIEKTRQQYINELIDLKQHGILYPTQVLAGETPATIANYIQIRNQLGFPCDKYYFLYGIGDANSPQVAANLRQLKTLISAATTCSDPKIYLYAKDEARGELLDQQLANWREVHAAGGKVFVAGFKGSFMHTGKALDTLVLSGPALSSEIDAYNRAGSEVFSYDNPQSGVPDPKIYRDNYGIYLWQHNYSGAMAYAYQDAFPGHSQNGDLSAGLCSTSSSSYCSIWNDFDSSLFYDHVFAYPTSNGVIDTLQFEGLRMAIDDTRYLQLTLALLSRCPKANTATEAKQLANLKQSKISGADAEQLLKKIITSLLAKGCS